jgi:hypothetical protein
VHRRVLQRAEVVRQRQAQTGNPQRYTLKPHQEIAIVVGKPPAKIPSSYKFLPGE